MEDGLLSLKWNNHKSTFFHILSGLRKKETYTDATLACEGRFFPVHKLVMSTCSDYFCEVFENTNCKSPVVILKDIKHHDLEALLDYMYLGEVDVKQNELAGLIKAAECLRIKGLAVPDEDPALSPKKTHIPESRLSPSAKRARRENVSDASSNAASCSNLNHHSLSPSRSHSSTISTTVPSQSVNSDTLSQVPSLSLPPSYTDKRHSSLSVNDDQKHIDQSDIVPVEMIKVEVDDDNSNNSQLQQSKDRPIGQSGSKENPRGEGSGNNKIEESHRDRDSISNNFSDYSAGNQSTDIEKEEHDQIDPFNESDQVAGPSGVQVGSQIVNWGEEEGSFPHNLFGNEDSSHQQVCIAIVEPEMLAVRMFQGPKSQYVMNQSPLQLTQGERNLEREKTIGHPQEIQQPKLSPSLHQLRGPEPHYVVYQPTVQSVDQFQKKNAENLHQLEIIHSVPSNSLILSTPTISSPVMSSQVLSPSMQSSIPTISVMTHEKPASSTLCKKPISSKRNSKPKTSVKRKITEQANYAKHRKMSPKRKKKLELLLSASKENFKNEKEKVFQSSQENMPLITKIEITTASEVRSEEVEETNVNISQEHLANQLPEVDENPIHENRHLSPRKQDSNLTSLNLSDSSSSTTSPQDLSNRQHRLHYCPYCQYHSKSKVDLNKHIRVHTKEKPYKCNLCKYETGDKSNFKRHITCVHKCEYLSAPNSSESLNSSIHGQQIPTQANVISDTSARETVSTEDQEELQQRERRHHQHFPVILDPHQNVQERPTTLIEHPHPLVYSAIEIPHHPDATYSSEIEQPPSPQPIPSMQIHSVEICSPIPYSHSITTTPAVSSSSTTP